MTHAVGGWERGEAAAGPGAAAAARPHRHPNYVAIWGVLVVLLGLSVGVGRLGHTVLATVLIFLVAAMKASLVAAYYMHLRFEPRWLTIVMACAVAYMVVLFAGLFPDIVRVYGG